MALSRSIPLSYPQALAVQMLKAEAQRQASTLRQEIVTELLSVLSDTREANVRSRLIKLIEQNLRAGIAALHKAEGFWPEAEDAKNLIAGKSETRPAAARKHQSLFEQLDRVHVRSIGLLKNSFEHTQVILDRVQPPDQPPGKQVASSALRT